MTKSEILEVLYQMKISFMIIPLINKCNGGFCRWLFIEFGIDSEKCDWILDELAKDFLNTYPDRETYWYENYQLTKNFEASIIPRIDHLNRTIARLENEIKTAK